MENRSMRKSPLFAVVLVLISACSDDSSDSSNDSNIGDGNGSFGKVTISLIQMNDLHANLTGHKDAFRNEDSEIINIETAGGISRIATQVKSIREASNGNSILMNIGDTFHGGAEAMFTNGNAIVDAVDQLNIDIGVPGNWDYAYGPIVTNARFGNLQRDDVLSPNYEMLAANATYRIPPNFVGNPIAENLIQSVFNFTAGDPFLAANKIIEKSGIRIGFIGITSDIVEFMHPVMAFNLEFVQGIVDYQALIEQQATLLRADGADLVVVMSELGIQKDWALAKQLNAGSVDIIFSAHTHEVTEEPLQSESGILVVEAGNDSYLGQMDITFEDGKIEEFNWQLHKLDAAVVEDPEMLALVEQIRAPFLAENPNISTPAMSLGNPQFDDLIPAPSAAVLLSGLDQVLATSALPLERRHSLENNFNNWFSDRLRSENQTDIAMTTGFRFDAVIVPSLDAFDGQAADYIWQSETPEILNGEILVADAYRFFPAPFNIAKGNVSVARLKEIIESNLTAVYSTDAFSQQGGWLDGFSGIELNIDLTATEGQKVKSLQLTIDGSFPEDETIVSVTGCARPFDLGAETTLCAYDGFTEVETLINPVTGEAFIAADYFIQTLTDANVGAEQDSQRQSIIDQSAQPQWPISSFYQPLEGL